VARVIAEYLTHLPGRPVHQDVPWPLRTAWAIEEPPDAGVPAEAILDRFAEQIAPYPFGNGHPRFYGWVNSPPAVIGVFAEALAAAMNPSVAGGDTPPRTWSAR
jgi:aromatic-L-amino-acid/L-tryptophan decarboxylase